MLKLKSKFDVLFITPLTFIISLLLSSCTVAPIKPESIVIDNKSGIHLPANARLAIHMESSQLNKKYTVVRGLYKWQLDEGRKIQDAAKKVFAKLFTKALPSRMCRNPHLIAKVSGSSYIDYHGKYEADANVTLTFGNRDFIGEYAANGEATSGMINDADALENAYIKAFKLIAADILKENKLSEYFNNGFPDDIAALSTNDSITKKKEPLATISRLPSIYDALIDAVVVVNSTNGIGTGFFISTNGYIITNNHVVGSDSTLSLRLRDGRTILGNVEKRIPEKDLALIKVYGDSFPWLVLGNLSDAPVGLEVLAIGTPEGLDWSIAKGIVSAHRPIKNCTLIQTDTAINQGNSGGPLISLKSGKVVGVNTLGFKKHIAEGLNFAVSSQDIIESFPTIQKIK